MIRRSKHNLSATALSTFDPGEFIPYSCLEIIPGDGIRGNTDAILRCLPLLAPIMHEVEVNITHAYVPYRLIWEDFEDFITGGDDGLNASTLPTIDFSGGAVANGDLANYLGLPIGFDSTASALPFRAYSLFYNDHLRDEELQTELTIDLTSGADTTTNTTLKNVNWGGSRFTKSESSTQLGTAVTLPLGSRADVLGIGIDDADAWSNPNNIEIMDGSGGTTTYTTDDLAVNGPQLYGGSLDIYADLSNATGATINELREALALQKFMEMRQIYGSTYEKVMEMDYGVKSQDGRLSNSEILSRGRGKITFSEVLATAETGTSVDVGDMKGHGIAAMRTNRFQSFFPEFGLLMSFISVRPKEQYSQGVPRHFLKSTKEDFYNKNLESMGMQEITNREVKYDHSTPGGTFAYEPRFNEYKSNANTAAGDFANGQSLEHWHMARSLSGDPAKNSSFITCSPTQRVFAQSTTDNLLGMFRNRFIARRLVKKSNMPSGLI